MMEGNLYKSNNSRREKLRLKVNILPKNLKAIIIVNPESEVASIYKEIEKYFKSFKINYLPVRIELDGYVVSPHSIVKDIFEDSNEIVAYSAENNNPLNIKKNVSSINSNNHEKDVLNQKRTREENEKHDSEIPNKETKKRKNPKKANQEKDKEIIKKNDPKEVNNDKIEETNENTNKKVINSKKKTEIKNDLKNDDKKQISKESGHKGSIDLKKNIIQYKIESSNDDSDKKDDCSNETE